MKTTYFLLLLLINTVAFSQTETINIKGQIKDNTGKPVPFAAIFIQKTNTGAYADSAGNFSIATKQGDKLVITAIGFVDTSYITENKNNIVLYLKRDSKNLENVNVKGQLKQNPPGSQDPSIAEQQIISNTLSDYSAGQNISYSVVTAIVPRVTSGNRTSLGMDAVLSPTSGNGGYYRGNLLPVFTHTEATRGNRYLFDNWVTGNVINVNNVVISNDTYWFNYDKIGEVLLVTQDKKNVIEVDKQNIKVFDLKGANKEYVFEYMLVDKEMKYVQVLVKNPANNYALYKTTKTKFKKNDYVNTGLVETGHNYDEYIDVPSYYISQLSSKGLKLIELKKKSIKEAFPNDQSKIDTYLSQHSDAPINEDFLIGLVAAFK